MSRTSKAVIVAAGLSSRLYPLTANLPKGLLEIAGETILGRSVRLLRESGTEDILVVVGFRRSLIQEALGAGVHFRFNPFFAETNNMASLWFAKEWVGDEPFLYSHGDIVYAPELLRSLLGANCEDVALSVDCGPADKEAMKVRVEEGRFVESNKDIPCSEASGEWIGMTLFHNPRALFNTVEMLMERKHFQAYDTLAFTEMARIGTRFSIIPTEGHPWIEIDDEQDLKRARKMFT